MASPITTLGTATIGPPASVTLPSAEVATSAQAPPVQQHEAAAPTAPLPQRQDKVEISSQALNLSKELANKQEAQEKQPALNDEYVKRKLAEPVIQKPTDKPDISIIKNYPPYLGSSEELKQLKAQAPALYRQILRMIVPPPTNISYSDAQLLQRPTIDAKS